ncbi:hypothetical protein BGW37DRAFT_534527 [Umbelopsis sp. PMI_123]|nr:hypothetical protein BGW37DRAFT_534527 [Umbelopsis sp. PMI_123]
MQDLPNQPAAADLESLQQSNGDDDDLIFDIAELGLFAPNPNDSDEDSNFSLDYEYIGPRQPKYADSDNDCESVASDISMIDSELAPSENSSYFDMWDEDIYSTNDYTWESNDMRLSLFVKQRNCYLRQREMDSPWHGKSFWRKDRGWPMQLPNSCSTTNHDQSANSLCAVKSNMAVSEHLLAFYKDRIVKCGESSISSQPTSSALGQSDRSAQNPSDGGRDTPDIWKKDTESNHAAPQVDDKPGSIFLRTHASIALPTYERNPYDLQNAPEAPTASSILELCTSYTKHLKRAHFVPPSRDNAYIYLGFEPLCLDHKFGYMAVGGIEGELLVYCELVVTRSRVYLFTATLEIFISHLSTTLISSALNDNNTSTHYSSQHVAWSNDSTLFAHTSDSHYCVLVWSVESKEILLSIDAAGFTYALAFHPSARSILAFSNRYGYFHTVDLDQTVLVNHCQESIACEDNFLSTIESNSHCTKSALERSTTIIPRQEITMVSFRGEKNTKLRILAKINGICWSGCGQYLYVATKKRVLVYEFISRGVRSLVELAGDQARKILELTRKRKRLLDESFDYEPWYRKWKRIPEHLQYTVLGDNVGLANHD